MLYTGNQLQIKAMIYVLLIHNLTILKCWQEHEEK